MFSFFFCNSFVNNWLWQRQCFIQRRFNWIKFQIVYDFSWKCWPQCRYKPDNIYGINSMNANEKILLHIHIHTQLLSVCCVYICWKIKRKVIRNVCWPKILYGPWDFISIKKNNGVSLKKQTNVIMRFICVMFLFSIRIF